MESLEEKARLREEARQRRKRDLLRNYYGTLEAQKQQQQEQPQSQEGRKSKATTPRSSSSNQPPSTTTSSAVAPNLKRGGKEEVVVRGGVDPTNIDDPCFDVDKYFAQLLKTSSAKALLKKDESMLKEIKKLDSDMKTLVYENYNKFISATDTIRNMKSNVENMEEEMKRLSQNMEKISEATEQINTTLAPRRARVQELSGLYRLLKKRQFLFELPSRLRQAVEMGSYNQAVRYFGKTHRVLHKYSHVPSFRSILVECQGIMQNLQTTLRQKLELKETSATEAGECMGLLLELSESPETADKLREVYVEKRGALIMAILNEFRAQVEQKSGQLHTTAKPETKQKPVGEVKEGTTTKSDVEEHDELKEGQELLTFLKKLDNEFLAQYMPFYSYFKQLFISQAKTTTSRTKAVDSFDDYNQRLFDEYLYITSAALLRKHNTQYLIEGLRQIRGDLAQVHSQAPELGLMDVTDDVIDKTVQNLIQRSFNTMKNNVLDHLLSLCAADIVSDKPAAPAAERKEAEKDDVVLSQQCNDVASAIIEEVEQFLDKLKLLFVFTPANSFMASHTATFFTKVVVNIQQLFLSINIQVSNCCAEEVKLQLERLRKEAEQSNTRNNRTISRDRDDVNYDVRSLNKSINGTAALQLARVCYHIASWGVPHIHKVLQDLAIVANYSSENNLNVEDLIRRAKESSSLLLAYYVKRQGQKVSQMIQRVFNMRKWATVKEPRKVTEGIELVASHIIAISHKISQLFDRGNGEIPTPSVPEHRGHRRSRSYQVETSHVFEKKLKYFGPVAPTADGIMMAILKISLKAFCENVRLKTFNRNAYQQIQVDCFYLGSVLRTKFATLPENERLFDRLMGEIMGSAADRCIDPHPTMEHSIVAAITRSKIEAILNEDTTSDITAAPTTSE